MFEAIGLNLVASMLFKGMELSEAKARELHQREAFAKEVDELTATFTAALKESITPALTEHTQLTTAAVEEIWDWPAIADALNDEFAEESVWIVDEAEAIARLTDVIAVGTEANLDTNLTARRAVEAAVADAYRTTVRAFIDRAADTEVADVFLMETNTQLTTAVNELDDRLTAVQRELQWDTAALQNQGFDRLDSLYFERHEPSVPETVWRTGFTFADVQAGYPLPRERPAYSDGERVSLTDEVYEQLTAGEHVVVVGEAGSGKSTVCKQVACQWYDDNDRGAVLYRESATTTAFDEPGTLVEAIRATEDELLVVVEDAPREDANTIFEVLAMLGEAEEVAVLLDARTGNWDSGRSMGRYTRLDRQRRNLSRIDMPPFDERECQRAIEHYQGITGQKTGRTSEQMFQEVRAIEIGGPLVVAYQLAGPAIDTERLVSALHEHVRQTYTTIEEWADGDLQETVAVMINVLNAADLPVEAAFIHALAADQADHRRIERILGFLEGIMFEQDAGGLRMPHSQWSALYLECMLDVAGERLACARFEQCVRELFRLTDEEPRRERVQRWMRTVPETFTAITETPEETAGRFVQQVAEIGAKRPTLGVLYGPFGTWGVSLPEPCPSSARFLWVISRGQIHHDRGALDAAQAEFERADQLIDAAQNEFAAPIKYQALVRHGLGLVANDRGELGMAEEYHEESLALCRKIGDHHGEASNLNSLGAIANDRREFRTAEEYYEESLVLCRKIGDRHGEVTCLTNLGLVANERREFGTAEEYHEESLALCRKIGDRHGKARCLTNLGTVARTRGELEVAEEYYEESLALLRETGDRHGEARCLTYLGVVAYDCGELETAEEYHEKSLALLREIGDRLSELICLTFLGFVANDRGEVEAAAKFFKEAAALHSDNAPRADMLEIVADTISE